MTIVAITGHRPEKITDFRYVETQLRHAFHDFDARRVIQGMAAGVDLVAAKTAYQMHIPYWCAVPYKGHKARTGGSNGYVPSWEAYYENALLYAEEVHYVTDYESYPGAWVFQKRNEWMVDHANFVVAVWDGSNGGTKNCVDYAIKKKLPIWRIDPLWHEVSWHVV